MLKLLRLRLRHLIERLIRVIPVVNRLVLKRVVLSCPLLLLRHDYLRGLERDELAVVLLDEDLLLLRTGSRGAISRQEVGVGCDLLVGGAVVEVVVGLLVVLDVAVARGEGGRVRVVGVRRATVVMLVALVVI